MVRAGLGFDAHRFEAGRKLILGGVEIAGAVGLHGHSDADVLLHALTDALLGAAGLGDIGMHFPDSDPQWKNVSSRIFIERALSLLRDKKFKIVNADITLVAESPRLESHRGAIRNSVAAMLQLSAEAVNIKASTVDRMGFIGRNEGIAAQAIVLIESV
jgi:2-C-methyl-D-erythritol 2,4-cyclodiphosphate synthase